MARTGLTSLPHAAASGTLVPGARTLTEQYREVRGATVALCSPLATEDYVVQSMPDASPAKWHLAHTSWFFEEFVLQQAGAAYEFHEPDFRFLFNSYYNAVGPMHTRSSRGMLSRPTVQQVLAYRARVDERMSELLHDAGQLRAELVPIITLGLHHEQQHQELIVTDIKHLFSCNPLLPAYIRKDALPSRAAPALAFRNFDGGLLAVGHTGPEFCFDNELPRHQVYLAPFDWPPARSRTPSTSNSSATTATRRPLTGSPMAGRPCSASNGRDPSTGRTRWRRSSRYAASSHWIRTRP